MSYTNPRTAQGDNTVDMSYSARCTESKDYEKEYDKMPIWDQLGKILDSQGNELPLDSVLCDDDVRVAGITAKDCIDIRNVLLSIEKPADRKIILDKIQMSEGMSEMMTYVRSQRG